MDGHAVCCGAGVGVLLVVRRCKLYLLHTSEAVTARNETHRSESSSDTGTARWPTFDWSILPIPGIGVMTVVVCSLSLGRSRKPIVQNRSE